MRYISDKTNKVYDSVEELEKAEKKFDDAVNAEKVREAQKESRQKEIEDARNKYYELLEKYEKDYPESHARLSPLDFLVNW